MLSLVPRIDDRKQVWWVERTWGSGKRNGDSDLALGQFLKLAYFQPCFFLERFKNLAPELSHELFLEGVKRDRPKSPEEIYPLFKFGIGNGKDGNGVVGEQLMRGFEVGVSQESIERGARVSARLVCA